MTTPATSSTRGSYVLDYRLRSTDFGDPHRPVTVHATPQEVEQFVRDGYLARERLVQGTELEELRSALDEVAEADYGPTPQSAVTGSRQFGGLFVRSLLEKHRAFHRLVTFQPVISVIRAVLGPQVQMRGVSARITFPDAADQETHWHFHQRIIPDPVPPFFNRPHTIEALIYLDEVNDANGPLCVMPGSHQWLDRDPPNDEYDDKPGQEVLRLPAGSCVLVHGSLWHRAMPTRPEGTVRRLLIVGFGPPWMRPWARHERPPNALTDELLADADQETDELLGASGWT